MKPLLKSLIFASFALFSFNVNAQAFIPAYGAISEQCSQAGILSNLSQFENFGIKYRNTAAQANTLQWLKDKYLSYGYTASQIVEDPFTYSGSTCKNLVVTKTGTLYPNTFVIICGHYDTVNGPGTNDNGSGVSVILEVARLLQNVPTEYSIKFINFAGEEDGLIGSDHYVDNVVNSTSPKMDIRLVFNLDQVGGVAGETNNTITCERDQSNPTLNNAASNIMTTQLMNCVELYSPLNATLSFAYGSDYVPFENNGEIITGLYETNESVHPHTATDLLINMDPVYVYNVAKATTGATLHFAVACTNCNLGINTNSADFNVSVFPNPASGLVYINKGDLGDDNYSIELIDFLGKNALIKIVNVPSQTESLDVSQLGSGMYFLKIKAGDKSITKKVMIK